MAWPSAQAIDYIYLYATVGLLDVCSVRIGKDMT